MSILSPLTDNWLFLKQRKREIIFPQENVLDSRIDHGIAACKADMLVLPTELLRPVVSECMWLAVTFWCVSQAISQNCQDMSWLSSTSDSPAHNTWTGLENLWNLQWKISHICVWQAVQRVSCLNRNAIVLWRFTVIECLYESYYKALISMIRTIFFRMLFIHTYTALVSLFSWPCNWNQRGKKNLNIFLLLNVLLQPVWGVS